MSLVINSMAARMFCWVSARWVTVKVAFIPIRNSWVIAMMTIRPTAEATINSRRVNPRCDFSKGIVMVFIRLVVAGDQRIHVVGASRPAGFGVGDGDRDRDQILINAGHAVDRLRDRIESDGAGEISQALRDVVGGAENAIGAGQNEALDSSRASRTRVRSGAGDIVGRAHQAIGSSALKRGGPAHEDSAIHYVIDLCERKLLAVAGRVDAFHGIERLVACNQIFLSGGSGGDGRREAGHYG